MCHRTAEAEGCGGVMPELGLEGENRVSISKEEGKAIPG